MISLYTSLFWAIKNSFDYNETLVNFCNFAEEVCLSINTIDDDGTFEAIKQWKTDNKANHLNIIESKLDRNDPWFDGKLKQVAHAQTKFKYKLGIDADERIPLNHRPEWDKACQLLDNPNVYSILIPTLDIWGEEKHIRFDEEKNIAFKWYLNKEDCIRRPVKQALLADGIHINTLLSDGCEVTVEDGTLAPYTAVFDKKLYEDVKTHKIINSQTFDAYMNYLRQTKLYVYHIGYLNFKNRIERNKNFWKTQWAIESGKETEVPLHEFQLFKPTYPIDLPYYK